MGAGHLLRAALFPTPVPAAVHADTYEKAVAGDMKGYDLRQATAEDFPKCLGIRNGAMREYIEQIRGWDEDYEERRFRGNFQPDKTRVILSDDSVIGFLGVREEDDALYVAQAYIIPEYQGAGNRDGAYA